MEKLIAGGLLLFWGGWCFGQQSGAWNGTRWKNLGELGRTCYVAGFARGHADGMREAADEVAKVIKTVWPPESWTPEKQKLFAEKTNQMEQKSAITANFTIGQVEDTTSTFYEDYRNMSVCWDDAIKFSGLSLNGTAASETELNAARKAGAKSGCP